MTYHEFYGELPKRTLSLIKKYNVSPADWSEICRWVQATGASWKDINDHILNLSPGGYYNCPYDYFHDLI